MAIAPLSILSENKNIEQSERTTDHNIPKNILSLLTFFIGSTVVAVIILFILWVTKNMISKCFNRRQMKTYSYVHIKSDYGSISSRDICRTDNVLIQERNNDLI